VTDDELDWLIRAPGQRAEDSFVVAVPDHAAVWGLAISTGIDNVCRSTELRSHFNRVNTASRCNSFGAPVKWWRETGCGGALNRPEFS